MDAEMLAHLRAGTDHDGGGLASIGKILREPAKTAKGVSHAAFPHRDAAVDMNMGDETHTVAEASARAYHAKRANLDPLAQVGLRMDDGAGMDLGAH
jgi:hypothetical protein